jgi:hypothetical protein
MPHQSKTPTGYAGVRLARTMSVHDLATLHRAARRRVTNLLESLPAPTALVPRALVKPSRSVMINLRLRAPEAARLHRLAKSAGVGHSTLARLIIERYLQDHAPKSAS